VVKATCYGVLRSCLKRKLSLNDAHVNFISCVVIGTLASILELIPALKTTYCNEYNCPA